MDNVSTGHQGISVHRLRSSDLKFADDINMIVEEEGNLERFVNQLNKEGKQYGLLLNVNKTESVLSDSNRIGRKLSVGNETENVERFTYLGITMMYGLDCKTEISV